MNPNLISGGTEALKCHVLRMLDEMGYAGIGIHSVQVSEEAVMLARRFDVDPDKAAVAALLHDIGVMIPSPERIGFLAKRGIVALPEERIFPLILHQRVSFVLAKERYNIHDADVLSAVCCHTTLKAGPSKLDMVLFLADKISWDQEGFPPYLAEVLAGLNTSLARGSLAYISYLIQQKEQLKVLHPWLSEAYRYLLEQEKSNNSKE